MNVRHAALATALTFGMFALTGHAQQRAQEPEERSHPVARTTADAAEQVGDAWITTKVKADLLATEDVPGSTIDVDTEDGVVTLNGKVGSQAEAEKAVSVAKSIKGVTQVKSNLKVEPPSK